MDKVFSGLELISLLVMSKKLKSPFPNNEKRPEIKRIKQS